MPRLRLAERRRRARNTGVLLTLFLLIVAAGGVAALSHHSRLTIRSIAISGVERLEPAAVQRATDAVLHDGAFHILARDSMFLYPRREMEAALLREFPRIASLSIARESFLSQTLRVSVVERKSFALWCSVECFLMDDGGFIFARAEGQPARSYIFSGGLNEGRASVGQTFLYGRLNDSLRLLELLGQAGFEPRGLSVESEQDLSVPMNEGFTMLATFDEDAETLVRRLTLALASDVLRGREAEVEYVDLRFGNKLYYKMKGALSSE